MLSKTLIILLFGCAFSGLAVESFSQDKINCGQKLTDEPRNYPKGSELYFLAFVERGTPDEKVAAAMRLLDLEKKSEYTISRKIWYCLPARPVRSLNDLTPTAEAEFAKDRRVSSSTLFTPTAGLAKDLMLLVLFDHYPEQYRKDVSKMIKPLDVPLYEVGEPIRVDFEAKTEWLSVDQYSSAAIRLIRHGFLSDASFEKVLDAAGSANYGIRQEVDKTFALFSDIPKVEVGPSELTEKQYGERSKRLKAVKRWFSSNKERLKWSPQENKYRISN